MTGCLQSGHMTVCDSTINTQYTSRLGLELIISERFVLQMWKTFNITQNGVYDVISNSVTLYIVFLFEAVGLKHLSLP